jgi:hypothetical protein
MAHQLQDSPRDSSSVPSARARLAAFAYCAQQRVIPDIYVDHVDSIARLLDSFEEMEDVPAAAASPVSSMVDVPQGQSLDPEDYFWTIWRDIRDERFRFPENQWIEIRGTLDGNEKYQGFARPLPDGQWELCDHPGFEFPQDSPFEVYEWRVIQPILDECPFCHSRDTEIHAEIHRGAHVDSMNDFYVVVCHSCQAQGSQRTYYTDAVESWNSLVRREKS